jgi:hypothetical protein
MRRSEKAKPSLPDQWAELDLPPFTGAVPPRLELSFVPSRPAPRVPVAAKAQRSTALSPTEFVRTVDHYEEALRSLHAAEQWSWPNPPLPLTSSSSVRSQMITPSSSGCSPGGPLTPSTSGLPDCLPPVPDTPAHCDNMSERDLLHGELEFELAEERRHRMMQRQRTIDFGMPTNYSQKRMSLGPAWQGQAF